MVRIRLRSDGFLQQSLRNMHKLAKDSLVHTVVLSTNPSCVNGDLGCQVFMILGEFRKGPLLDRYCFHVHKWFAHMWLIYLPLWKISNCFNLWIHKCKWDEICTQWSISRNKFNIYLLWIKIVIQISVYMLFGGGQNFNATLLAKLWPHKLPNCLLSCRKKKNIFINTSNWLLTSQRTWSYLIFTPPEQQKSEYNLKIC